MRGLAITALFLGLTIGPAVAANDVPQVSQSATVQLPSDVVARLPAPQTPGEMRRAYIKNSENRPK